MFGCGGLPVQKKVAFKVWCSNTLNSPSEGKHVSCLGLRAGFMVEKQGQSAQQQQHNQSNPPREKEPTFAKPGESESTRTMFCLCRVLITGPDEDAVGGEAYPLFLPTSPMPRTLPPIKYNPKTPYHCGIPVLPQNPSRGTFRSNPFTEPLCHRPNRRP